MSEKMRLSSAVVFFGISNILASVRGSAEGNELVSLRPYPGVPDLLEALRREGARLGILSDSGAIPGEEMNDGLRKAGLFGYFDEHLIHYGAKDTTEIFERATASARVGGDPVPPSLLFVSTDAAERARARSAGFLTALHPLLSVPVLLGWGALRYLRIRVGPRLVERDWREMLRALPVVPLRVSTEPGTDAHTVVDAVADTWTAAVLDDLGFWVERLGAENEPDETEAYLVVHRVEDSAGLDAPESTVSAPPRSAARVLASTHEGLIVTVLAGSLLDSLDGFSFRHCHGARLLGARTLLDPPSPAAAARESLAHALPREPRRPAPVLTQHERDVIAAHVVRDEILREVGRYSGELELKDKLKIRSRDIFHLHNLEAVSALAADFERIAGGRLRVARHRFTHLDLKRENVEAVLPRAGLSGIVIVSAHLDSFSREKASGRAPGADDDASGIAAVLCAARALLELAAVPGTSHREIRFVLFNSEEYQLAGSADYARDLKSLSSEDIAVFQMDMIGFDGVPPRIFESHSGSTGSSDLRRRSRNLAELVAALASRTTLEPQLVPEFEGGDDPADEYSDHSSFHSQGIPACLICEDFWPDAQGRCDRNPDWHTHKDETINAEYAADIARAVAAAAWIVATR